MENENLPKSNTKEGLFHEITRTFPEYTEFKETEIARLLTDIVYETQLEKYNSVEVTNTNNSSVEKKAEVLSRIPQIKDKLLPDSLESEYPIQFDKDTLEKAPWVNMIHAWNKVLNELNTVSAMQKGETPVSPLVLASIVHSFYNFTTYANGDPFIRRSEDFIAGQKYVETVKRESGTKGVNPKRHVCLEEMRYILSTIKDSFAKER